MQQEQQGNGLVGGSIGLALGGVGGYYAAKPASQFLAAKFSGVQPKIDMMPSDDWIRREVSQIPVEEWGYRTDTAGNNRRNYEYEERARVKADYENEVLKSVKANADWYHKKNSLQKSLALMVQLGLPITTALLGSTLTD